VRRSKNTRSSDAMTAVLLAVIVVLAAASILEYSEVQSLNNQVSSERSEAEVVYNLQGISIPVICCPDLASSIVVGNYLLSDSSISPVSSYTVNGTAYSAEKGVMLLFEVAPLSAPNDVQSTSFVWGGSFNESVPFPRSSSIFGGAVDFHWYVLDGLLFMHVEAG
jgi:hypothetical protein